MRSTKIEWIYVLRVSLVMAVVVFHATGWAGQVGTPGWASTSVSLLDPYRMPLLMMLAGVFTPGAVGRGARRFVTRRLSSLGWPYLVWTTTPYLAYRGGEHVIDHSLASELVHTDQVTWFLLYLLGFSLVTIPMRSIRVRALVLAAALLLTPLLSAGLGTEPHRAGLLFTCFLAGTLIDPTHLSAASTSWRRPSILAAASLGTLAVAVLGATGDLRWMTPLWFAGAVAALVVSRSVFGVVATTRIGRKVGRLGDCTVVVLVVHMQVMGILSETIRPLHLPWVVGFALVCVAGVAGSLAAVAVVRRCPGLWVLFDLRRGVEELRSLRLTRGPRRVVGHLRPRPDGVLTRHSKARTAA